jgi:threonine synthase
MTPTFTCRGCGADAVGPAHPFRCQAARDGDDIDHVLVRTPAAAGSAELPALGGLPEAGGTFERYGPRLSHWALGLSHGLCDREIREIARRLDQGVAEVDGRGFSVTPFEQAPTLAEALGIEAGRLWVKDETGNVSGSHKGRHLMGIMLYLLVAERVGLPGGRPPLAIASCGNAALAAAVVARAASWPLQVFVPPTANPGVRSRLVHLGADVITCPREHGIAGDPCYLAFRRAVAAGAVPFCCQGPDNGMTIEGGETLAWEMVSRLGGLPLDAVFVQVGGGALATAVIRGFEEARREHAIDRVPAVFAVQTVGDYPLVRAYDRLVARMLADWPAAAEPTSESPAALAEMLARETLLVDEAMAFARSHRSQFMWPWEQEPHSVAHGILDDETYDWAAIVEGMLRSGGRPIVVGEARLHEANDLARSLTGIDADHTGTAGLAGLLEAVPGEEWLRHARVAVIFSGVRR